MASNEPDWHRASCELMSHLQDLKTSDERVGLLQAICKNLGYEEYPVFLKILCVIEAHGDSASRALLTETIRHGLQTGRLPSGPMPGWGSPFTNTNDLLSRTKQHGPIEYICIWYTQPNAIGILDTDNFKFCLGHLLRLLSEDSEITSLYSKKLLSDANNPLSSAYSSSTKRALSQLASDWLSGHSPESVLTAYLTSFTESPFCELDKQLLLRQL